MFACSLGLFGLKFGECLLLFPLCLRGVNLRSRGLEFGYVADDRDRLIKKRSGARKRIVFSELLGFGEYAARYLIKSLLSCSAVGIHLEHGSKLAISIGIRWGNQMPLSEVGARPGQMGLTESGQFFRIAVGIGTRQVVLLGKFGRFRRHGFA